VSDRSPGSLSSLGRLGAAIAIVAIGSLSLFASNFWLQTGLFAMAAATAAIGLSLLVGTAGQLSLGHAFFIAVGAYGYAWLAGPTDDPDLAGLGLPPLLAAVLAVLLAGLAGAIFSPISGRLSGIYLGLASLGLVFLGQHVMVNAESITGGFNGRDAAPMRVPGFAFDDDEPTSLRVLGQSFDRLERLWVLFLVVVVVAMWLARNVLWSRTGRAWATMRDSETAATVLGIKVSRAKAAAFTVSSMYAGLGGVLTALAFSRIVPESFALALSIDMLVMIVVGGVGTVGGATVGAVFVTALPLVLDRYSGSIPFVAEPGQPGFTATIVARMLYGLAIVVVLLFSPAGISAIWSDRGGTRRRSNDQSPSTPEHTDRPDTSPSNAASAANPGR
jgi:branched-chain amino acid transport system permease protein